MSGRTIPRLPGRPLGVGVQLPEVEREVRWPELRAIARTGRAGGLRLDLVGRPPAVPVRDRPSARTVGGVVDARRRSPRPPSASRSGRWSPRPRSTRRSCSPSTRRRSTRSPAAGSCWASGAGWNDVEFAALGAPFDHRISRFEESFTVVRTLLAEGAIDFDGTVRPGARRRAAAAVGAAGRPAAADRVERPADARGDGPVRGRAGTPGTRTPATRPAGVAPLRATVDAAAVAAGREPGRDRAHRRRPGADARRHRPDHGRHRPQAGRAADRGAARGRSPTRCGPTRARASGTSSSSSTRSPRRRSRRWRRRSRRWTAGDGAHGMTRAGRRDEPHARSCAC